MAYSKEMILKKLSDETYATLVTMGENGLSSRTMTFGYCSDDVIFMLTHKVSQKISDINYSNCGLLHIANIESEITKSIDISIGGIFELIDDKNPLFQVGKEVLGKKNRMVLDLLSSDEREDYQLIAFKITSLSGWDYIQMINGGPKTVLI